MVSYFPHLRVCVHTCVHTCVCLRVCSHVYIYENEFAQWWRGELSEFELPRLKLCLVPFFQIPGGRGFLERNTWVTHHSLLLVAHG